MHGDIKPKNIRIDARGDVRVLDFGIAKALSLSRRLTRNEFGSVPYASPERLDLGEVNVDSDLWSLAVMLYEMVTGLQPYQADTTERLERMIRSRIPPPPAPDPCPEPLRRILIKAMAPDPDLRYATARELADDLDAFRRGRAGERCHSRTWTPRGAPLPARMPTATRRDAPVLARIRRKAKRGARPAASVPPPARRSRLGMFRKTGRVLAVLLLAGCFTAAWAGISELCSLPARPGSWSAKSQPNRSPTPTRSGTNGRNFPRAIPRLSFCAGREMLVKQKLVAAADHVIDTYRNNDRSGLREATGSTPATCWRAPWRSIRTTACAASCGCAKATSRASTAPRIAIAADLNLAVEKFNEAQKLHAAVARSRSSDWRGSTCTA